MSAPALYVHIPFCTSFCPYCDFPKVFYEEDRIDSYFSSLYKEIKAKAEGPYDTIYIGGGTPTCVSPEKLDEYLSLLHGYLAKDGEFSIEANPETLTEEKIAVLAKNGINRVSMGVQSFHPRLLNLMDRKHDATCIEGKVRLLHKYRIDNINLDLMFALPDETLEEVRQDIEKIVALKPTHVSAYSLILEEGTKFSRQGYLEASQDDQADQYELVWNYLEEHGYHRYEVSNFALDGYKCRHNLHYWKDHDYDAVGLGASGHKGNVRYKNTVSFPAYINQTDEGEIETLDRDEEIECFLLSSLRLVDGFPLEAYQTRFGSSFLEDKAAAIEELKDRGLLTIENGTVKAKDDALLLLDQILVSLF